MSRATANATAPWEHTTVQGRGLSFLTLLRVEIRKQVDTRAGRGLLIVIAGLTVLAVAAVLWVTAGTGAELNGLLTAALGPQGLLLPMLGIITACNEWSQRTALITFTQEPRRFRVVLAKLLSAVVLGTVAVALACVLAPLAHVLSMGMAGQPVSLDLTWSQLGGAWLSQMLSILMGVAFGLALLSVPLAIVAYFVLPILFGTVTMLSHTLANLGPGINITMASAPLSEGLDLSGSEWSHLGTASLLWIGVPLLIGIWRVLTREVK